MAGIYFKNQKTMASDGASDDALRSHYVSGSRYGFRINTAEPGVTGDDFLVVWRLWPRYLFDEEYEDYTNTEIGLLTDEFGINSMRMAYADNTDTSDIDCAIVRKSDRKAIRYNSAFSVFINPSDLSIISDFANYPELQRLRLLGII